MFADLSCSQLLMVAVAAFGTQIVGGIAGYGTGLLMPLILVPLIGAEAAVPVISLAALISNPTRAITFWKDIDRRKAVIVVLCALPATAAGAYWFTLLTGRGAQILIGCLLIVMVPLRYLLRRLRVRLAGAGFIGASFGFGFLMGATPGTGVVLLSILMAAGLAGTQVIATDAAISAVLGVVRTGIYAGFGALPWNMVLLAVLIGAMATPGTLTARWISRRFTAEFHNGIFDAAIVTGGVVLLWQAFH
ncbi:MAG: sulfite exporter TauE/SafE family protein [Alphaproteobacteria bacterium]